MKVVERRCCYRQTYAERTFFNRAEYDTCLDVESRSCYAVLVDNITIVSVTAFFEIVVNGIEVNIVDAYCQSEINPIVEVSADVEVIFANISRLVANHVVCLSWIAIPVFSFFVKFVAHEI